MLRRALGALLALALLTRPARGLRAWVSTVVAADLDGERLLPHFVNYYHQLGVTYRRFLLLVHHDPAAPRAGLELALGTCQAYALECRVWEGRYDPQEAYARQLAFLNDHVFDPFDWVIPAELDELQEWPSKQIAQTLQDAVDAGASHIAGYRVERLAASGEAARVAAAARADAGDEVVSLFRQFPLRCRAAAAPDPGGADAEPPGADARVVAFRNYFRAARGGRAVVAPDDARTYFGSCSGGAPPPCRGRGGAALGLPADLWNITPYAVHEDHYLYRHTPPDAHGGKKFGLWRPGLYAEAAIPVHHFRWHAGGAGALAARLARLAGPGCAPDAPDAPGCAPLTRRWRAAARRAAALAAGGAVDLAGWECAMPRPGQEVPVDTTYQGLAWEQFEEALKVVSRVRNVAKGDSQSRMASKLGAGGGGGTAADVLKAVLAESGGGREAAAAEGGAAAGGAAAAAGGAAPALGGAGGGGGEEA